MHKNPRPNDDDNNSVDKRSKKRLHCKKSIRNILYVKVYINQKKNMIKWSA
jgi:hypothetical protein